MNRRHFLTQTTALTGSLLVPALARADHHEKKALFEISLAEWSLHKALFGKKMTNLDFPKVSKETYGINAVEWVNQFFKDKAQDKDYLGELKQRCGDAGVKSVLIMIDGEGHLGEAEEAKRQQVIDNHKKWVEAAAFLGCHSIRVNAHGVGADDAEKATNTVKGLGGLASFAKDHKINVIVENHGGLSSNGKWLSGVLKEVGMDNCGSLPDFGNFGQYDRYLGIKELMPFAKGVSAKSHDFDEDGNETRTDYVKALKLVLDAGYRGHVGVEYEGGKLSEEEGIKATKKLLVKVRDQLSKEYCLKIARLPDGSPEVFYTLQGEGVTAGAPAVFVRASLCNLHCVWCDTDYTWNWEGTPWPHERDSDPAYAKFKKSDHQIDLTPAEVAAAVARHECRRLVVTGGEPLLQQVEFIEVLGILRKHDARWIAEIETNGTIKPAADLDELTEQYNVSPKLHNSGNPEALRIKEEALAFFAISPKAWFKFVITQPTDLEEVGEIQQRFSIAADRILLMPEGRNLESIQARQQWLAERCRDHGYRFSNRLHVALWGTERGR